MKIFASIFSCCFGLLLCSCGTSHEVVVGESSVIQVSRYRSSLAFGNCREWETIIQRDTLTGEKMRVEKIHSNCRGAYTYETKHKMREKRNGKWVRVL